MVSRNRAKTAAVIVGLVGAAGIAGAAAGDATATTTDPDQARVPWQSGNAATECARVLEVVEESVKFDEFDTVTAPSTQGAVTITATDGYQFSWTSGQPVDAVIVKAATYANIYRPGGAQASLEPYYGPFGKQISHVTFCYRDTVPEPEPEPPTVGIPPIPVPPVHGDPVPPTGVTPRTPPAAKRPPMQITPPRFRGAACKRLRWGARQTLRLRFKTRPGRAQRVRVVVKVPRGLVLTTTAKRQGWKQRGGTLVRIFPKLKHRKKHRELRVRVVGIVPGRWIVRARVNGKLSNPYCRVVRRSPKPKLPPVTG